MDQDQDFSKLRNLLALSKVEMPADTQVDQFLIEFHRRQRAQLLVPASRFACAMEWLKEKAAQFKPVPAFSYASALAIVAVTAFVGFSQQVQVTGQAGSPFQISFKMPTADSALAMVGNPLSSASLSTKSADSFNFTSNRIDTATTRFVLANNPRIAYDATVAF